MKFHLKNYLKYGILYFGISLIITNCQKDDVRPVETQEIEQPTTNISTNYVQGESIPNIVSLLNPDFSSYSKSNSSKSTTVPSLFGSISIEDILEVIDTLGNQNYSFSLIPITPKPNSIFNLVVSKSNEATDIAIVEYRMAPDFAEAYYNGTKSMAEFTGSILTFPFNAVASNMFSKSSGNTCVQNIDEVVNCDKIDVDSGQVVSSGGGGNSEATRIGDSSTYTGSNGGTVTHNYGGGSAYWVCDRYGVAHSGPTGCGDGSGTWIINLPDRHTHKFSNIQNKSNSTSCCDKTNLDGSIGLNEARSKKINIITGALKLFIDSAETQWLNNNASNEQLMSLSLFLLENKGKIEAKAEASMRILAEMVNDPDPTTPQWDFSKKGTYKNRESLKYKATYVKNGEAMFLLENGLVLYSAIGNKNINNSAVQWTSEVNPDGYNYIYSYDTKQYYEYKIPPATYADADIDFLFKAFWNGVKTTARYATPLEDAIILIDGKDFDGVEQNREFAGIMVIVSIVPGGKLLKPVGKIVKGNRAWKIASKVGSKTIVKSADEIFASVTTNKNKAFFYSGKTNGIGGADKALEIAINKGGTTLEGLLAAKKIDLPKYDPNTTSISEIWNQVSEAYAKQASGEVRAVIGKDLRPDNIWEVFEFPALKANTKVTKIIKIDPQTLVETVIFTR